MVVYLWWMAYYLFVRKDPPLLRRLRERGKEMIRQNRVDGENYQADAKLWELLKDSDPLYLKELGITEPGYAKRDRDYRKQQEIIAKHERAKKNREEHEKARKAAVPRLLKPGAVIKVAGPSPYLVLPETNHPRCRDIVSGTNLDRDIEAKLEKKLLANDAVSVFSEDLTWSFDTRSRRNHETVDPAGNPDGPAGKRRRRPKGEGPEAH